MVKDDLKRELDAIFEANVKRVEKVEKARDLEAEAQAEFLAEFHKRRMETYRPALEEFANYIRPHGWTAKLVEEADTPLRYDSRSDRNSPSRPASVGLEFHHSTYDGQRSSMGYPHFHIYCDKRGRSVGFRESTIGPGHGGSSGTGVSGTKIEDLTSDTLQERLVAYFKKLMDNVRPGERAA